MPTNDERQVMEFEPITDTSGHIVWSDVTRISPQLVPAAGASDVERGPSGTLIAHIDRTETRQLSVLPSERMASQPAGWAEIVRRLRESEAGRGGHDVEMRPGGTLEVSTPKQASRPLSQLPKERMAGLNPAPRSTDIDDVKNTDPQNVEQWTPVQTGLLNGWKFRLRPEAGTEEFVFLAFRSPQDGNLYRIFVLKPNVDRLYGHAAHMVLTSVGGQRIPVICGPEGRAARTLAEARVHAGKWMLYTYLANQGHDPGFSR
ncbi:MAG: hypothetical protein ACRDR6_10640 [Pseudonocardiaceae bacterium]